MKIELKNIKVNLEFSQETTQFKADIYVNDVKVAYATNEGYGGPTNYNAYQGQHETLKAAESYCESLPPMVYQSNNKPFEIKSNLEHVVDDLLEKHIQAKETAKFNTKRNKDMLKGIVSTTGSDTQYNITSWKGKTIADMLTTPQGRAAIKTQITKLKEDGKTILNTNIPVDLL